MINRCRLRSASIALNILFFQYAPHVRKRISWNTISLHYNVRVLLCANLNICKIHFQRKIHSNILNKFNDSLIHRTIIKYKTQLCKWFRKLLDCLQNQIFDKWKRVLILYSLYYSLTTSIQRYRFLNRRFVCPAKSKMQLSEKSDSFFTLARSVITAVDRNKRSSWK